MATEAQILTILVALQLSKGLYKSTLFMQNKANFIKVKMNVNSILTKDYERNDIFAVPEKQSQFKPNFKRRIFTTGRIGCRISRAATENQ